MKKQNSFFEMEKYSSSGLPLVIIATAHSPVQCALARENGWELNQFLWITEGGGMFTAGGESFYLKKGQGFFTRKNVPHAYAPSGDIFSTSWVTFSSGESLLNYYNIGDWLIFDVPDFLEKSREQLSFLCSSAKTLALRSAHGYMWATELLDAVFSHELSPIEKIQRFLERNCNTPLTLEQIANEINMDKFTLCKYYRKETNETVMGTLKAIRIQRAKRLLKYGSDPISEVGKQCGYDSVSYFIKNFHEETGCTPLQYRQK